MKLSIENPPNYEDIKSVLNVEGTGAIFCYGDTIYNAPKDLRPDLIVHEEVHSKQQGQYPQAWWYKYLTDRYFRLDQELEAYSTQYKFVKKYLNNRLLKAALSDMARALSSEIYGSIIEYKQAESKIRNLAK